MRSSDKADRFGRSGRPVTKELWSREINDRIWIKWIWKRVSSIMIDPVPNADPFLIMQILYDMHFDIFICKSVPVRLVSSLS